MNGTIICWRIPTDGRSSTASRFRAGRRFTCRPFAKSRATTPSGFHFGPERWLARIDYDDGDGEERSALLETSISGVAEPLSPNAVRGLHMALSVVHARRDRANSLAGHQALAQTRALYFQAAATAATNDAMNALDSTLSLQCAQRIAARHRARILFTCSSAWTSVLLTLTTPGRHHPAFWPGRVGGSARRRSGSHASRLEASAATSATGGDVAFAEAFAWMTGGRPAISPPLLTLIALNQRALEVAFYGRWWRQLVFRAKHLLRSNTKAPGAPPNVVAHYDLGNDFYGLVARLYDELFVGAIQGDLSRIARFGAGSEIRARSATARAEGRGTPAGDRVWLGRLRRMCSASRMSSHRGQPFRCADGLRSGTRGRDGPAVECRVLHKGLSRRCRPVRRHSHPIEMFEAVGERYWPAYFRALRKR